MSTINNNLLLAADDGYNLQRSLRFRSSASSYLSRTPASSSGTQQWTYSQWVKRGSLSGNQHLLVSYNSGGGTQTYIRFTSDALDVFEYNSAGGSYIWQIQSSSVYRDPSSWYHIVVAVDTTQSTSSNRVKIWVNGVQLSSFTVSTYPTLNSNTTFNSNVPSYIGSYISSSGYFDGYLTEINSVSGQALTPSSFGANSPTTGVWQPKKYAGTYGTNGFYLPFTDNSALTSGSNAGLGKDFSGNGNYWNTNNISITSGSTYDSMTDVPTLTSATAANFEVINAVEPSSLSVSNANLTCTYSGTDTYYTRRGTLGVSSGKWYFEYYCNAINSTTRGWGGIATSQATLSNYVGVDAYGYAYAYGGQTVNSNNFPAYGATYTTGDIIGVAFDADNGTLTFYKNGTSQGTAFTGIPAGTYFPAFSCYGGGTISPNFGQRPFAYTPPTGYVALNTYNLPTPTIGSSAGTMANKYFDATTYTGNGTSQNITNSGSMQPDFVWIKARSQALNHLLFDSIRGATKYLTSNSTVVETTNIGTLTGFNSNGFSVSFDAEANGITQSLVGWQWRANGSGSSNTAGSITSTVSANTTSGFSIVTYTGNGSSGATVGHGLGVKPAMIIQKTRSIVNSWKVWHQSLPNANTQLAPNNALPQITLNSTSAYDSAPNDNLKAISSTLVTLGANDQSNPSGGTMVMYCFAEIAGFSKFGSYTGNGSTDGTFVYTGFRPKYVMIKRTDSAGEWRVMDTSRDLTNVMALPLFPNNSSAEATGPSYYQDFLSNGFKVRTTNADQNASGGTYVYMALAENPFKYSLAR